MKKKIILSVVSFLALAFAVIGCKNSEKTQNKNTTANKTTVKITTTAKTTEHVHSYGEWKIKNDAICLLEGIKEKECACGDKIDPKGHDYANDGTCNRDGYDLSLIEDILDDTFAEINSLEDKYYKLSLKAGTYKVISNIILNLF